MGVHLRIPYKVYFPHERDIDNGTLATKRLHWEFLLVGVEVILHIVHTGMTLVVSVNPLLCM